MVTFGYDQEPHWYKRDLEPAHNAPQMSQLFYVVQASSVFLLLFTFKLGTVMLHVPSLPAEITLATEATLRSSSTKLHGSIPTILTMVLPPLLILWSLWYMSKRTLPQPGKPHGTVSTVSELHRSADV